MSAGERISVHIVTHRLGGYVVVMAPRFFRAKLIRTRLEGILQASVWVRRVMAR
jgi:hypothetical protein